MKKIFPENPAFRMHAFDIDIGRDNDDNVDYIDFTFMKGSACLHIVY